jgi:hypothetical protein
VGNLQCTQKDGISTYACINPDGSMSWATANNNFIPAMNSFNPTGKANAGWLGQSNWTLPTDSCTTNEKCSGQESPMGDLYQQLMNQLRVQQGDSVVSLASANTTVGPFTNVQPYLYWSCQSSSPFNPKMCGGSPDNSQNKQQWSFSFGNGFQGTDLVKNQLYVTAFAPGPPTHIPFQALGAQQSYVRGSDGNLWLEQGPFGTVPPARVQVDGTVQAFQALDSQTVVVLAIDGTLWLELAPFGNVPPRRLAIDANVQDFQALDGRRGAQHRHSSGS